MIEAGVGSTPHVANAAVATAAATVAAIRALIAAMPAAGRGLAIQASVSCMAPIRFAS